jgi:hypothetical protein
MNVEVGLRPRYSQKRNTYMGCSLQCSLPNKSRTFSHVQYTASVPVFLFITLTNHRLVNIPYNQLPCMYFIPVCLHFLYTYGSCSICILFYHSLKNPRLVYVFYIELLYLYSRVSLPNRWPTCLSSGPIQSIHLSALFSGIAVPLPISIQ